MAQGAHCRGASAMRWWRHGGLQALLLLGGAAAAALPSPLEDSDIEQILDTFGLPLDTESLRTELQERLRGIYVVPSWVQAGMESMECYSCGMEACSSGWSLKPDLALPAPQACAPLEEAQCCQSTTTTTATTSTRTTSTSTRTSSTHTVSSTTTSSTTTTSQTTATKTTTGTTTSTTRTTTTSTTPFGGFDCTVEFDNLATAWSGWKLEWCCQNEGKGCPTDTATTISITYTGTSATSTLTTVATTSLTTASTTGITATFTETSSSLTSTNTLTVSTTETYAGYCSPAMDSIDTCSSYSEPELSWCCANRGFGCGQFDCVAGVENAAFAWSSSKLNWCCTCREAACPPTETATSFTQTSETPATFTTTWTETSSFSFCSWSNTTACPCGTVCTGCSESEFDPATCCVDRCGLEFALSEFGLPARSSHDLHLQLAAKLGDSTPAATCNALAEAGPRSNCTADLPSGARCQVDCSEDDLVTVGYLSCLNGTTVGTSECFFPGGNLTVEEKNGLYSGFQVQVDNVAAAAAGADIRSAELWREVIASTFGIDPSDVRRAAASVERRLGEAARRTAEQLATVLVSYEMVLVDTAASDVALALAANPGVALQEELLRDFGVNVQAVQVTQSPQLFLTHVGRQITTETTFTQTSFTETTVTGTTTTRTVTSFTSNPDAVLSGINALDDEVVLLIASLGGCAVAMFCMLVVTMIRWRTTAAPKKEEPPEAAWSTHVQPGGSEPAEPQLPSQPPQPSGFLTEAFERTDAKDVLEVFDDRPQRRQDLSSFDGTSEHESATESDMQVSEPSAHSTEGAAKMRPAASGGPKSGVARHNKIPETWEEETGTATGRRQPSASAMDYLTDSTMLSLEV